MIQPRTVYETVYPELNFYSVEKIGFTNMSDLMVDAYGILVGNGFQKANVTIIDEVGNEVGDAGVPSERYCEIESGGLGYKVGDTLELAIPDEIDVDQNLLVGHNYKILSLGTTDFIDFGASTNTIGTIFTAFVPYAKYNDRTGTGTGTAQPLDLKGPKLEVKAVNPVGAVTSLAVKVGEVNDWYRMDQRQATPLTYLGPPGTVPAQGATGVTYVCQGTYRGAPGAAGKPSAHKGDDTPFGSASISGTAFAKVGWATGGATSGSPADVAPTISPFGLGSNPRPREPWQAQYGYGANGERLWPRGIEMDPDATGFGVTYESTSAGIWFSVLHSTAYTMIMPGQEIILSTVVGQRDVQSYIPPGTKVKSVKSFEVVTGIRSRPELTHKVPSSTGAPVDRTYSSEQVTLYTYIELEAAPGNSELVNINVGDTLLFRGSGLTVNDNVRNPAGFLATLEATGDVDPINDPTGLFGNIKLDRDGDTSISQYLELNGVTDQKYADTVKTPKMHAGMSVRMPRGDTSVYLEPDLDLKIVEVIEEFYDIPNQTWFANVRLNKQYPQHSGLYVNCLFPEMQPWRVTFEVLRNKLKPLAGAQAMNVYAGTPMQLTDAGTVANVTKADGTIVDRAGMMGEKPSLASTYLDKQQGYASHGGAPGIATNLGPDPAKPTEGFVNREVRVALSPEAYPLNYTMTITNRGLFFGVWEGNWSNMQKAASISIIDKDSFFNWFLIQRPVDRENGRTYCKGRAPVFCVNSVGYRYWKFIVREEDITHPQQGDPWNVRDFIDPRSGIGYTGSAGIGAANAVQSLTATATTVGKTAILREIESKYRIPADTHTQDSYAIMNTTNQISLTEYNTYLISFLHNLTTPRFRYSEELDMIGQASADVCMSGNDVVLTAPNGAGVYGEPSPRTYRAMPSNLPYNTGLRICVIRDIPH